MDGDVDAGGLLGHDARHDLYLNPTDVVTTPYKVPDGPDQNSSISLFVDGVGFDSLSDP